MTYKDVSVDDVEIGMTIIKCDREWIKMGFFGTPLVNSEFIKVLKNYGVKSVTVLWEEDKSTENNNNKSNNSYEKLEFDIKEHISTIEEVEYLQRMHYFAQGAAKVMFDEIKYDHNNFDYSTAKAVIDGFVDKCFLKPNLAASISRLKNFDDYEANHAVNVCLLAMSLGKRFGMDENTLSHLGMSALFHDIGNVMIPEVIIKKPTSLDEDEYHIIKKHPIYSYEILKKIPEFSQEGLRGVLQHHERSDGMGYPLGLKEREISKFAKIIAIADVYDAITSDRVYKKGLTPTKAIGIMLSFAEKQLHSVTIKFLSEILGVYPPGTMVLLDTGEIAVVFQDKKDSPSQPIVIIVTDKNKKNIPPYIFDLSKYNLLTKKPYKIILSPLDHRQYNIDPNKIIENCLLRIEH